MTSAVRHNLLANIAGNGGAGLLGLAMMPLFFRYLGAEAYGLIGVYFLLQAWMPVLDAGITPTFSRTVAWQRGHDSSVRYIRFLLGVAEPPLVLMTIVVLLASLIASPWVAEKWLFSNQLSGQVLVRSLQFMMLALALRLLSGLYRAGLMALEKQIEANLLFFLMTVLRTVGALLYVVESGGGIVDFFLAQAVVGGLELAVFRWRLLRWIGNERSPIARSELRIHLRFAIGIAGLTLLWVLTSQVDKLVLSKYLPLSEYGLYSLGVHLSSIVLVANSPIQQAVLPRMTRLAAGGMLETLRDLYGLATAISVSLSIAVIAALAYGAEGLAGILNAENIEAKGVARIAAWYAAGNLAVGQMALCYMLQNAQGKLRLHAIGSVLLTAIQVPLMILVAKSGDAERTATVYTCVNVAFLMAWLPVAHKGFLPGGHLRWLRRDWVPPMLVGSLAALISVLWLPKPESAPALLASTIVVAMSVGGAALFAHRPGRALILERLGAFHHK